MSISGVGPTGGGAETAALRSSQTEKSNEAASPSQLAEKATAVVTPTAAPAVQATDKVDNNPGSTVGSQVDTVV